MLRPKLIISLPQTRWRKELEKFLRFLVVGVSGTLLDFAILSTLKYFWGWPTLPANLISYSWGIINNYLLSRYWVYPETKKRQSFVQLAQFALVSLIGLGLNNLLVLLLETPVGELLGNPAYGYLPAKIAATLMVLLWNFFANRFWTFGKIETKQPARLEDRVKPIELYNRRAA